MKSLSLSGGLFDTPLKRKRIQEIDSESNTDPNFWNDRKKSTTLLKEKKTLEDGVAASENLTKKLQK